MSTPSGPDTVLFWRPSTDESSVFLTNLYGVLIELPMERVAALEQETFEMAIALAEQGDLRVEQPTQTSLGRALVRQLDGNFEQVPIPQNLSAQSRARLRELEFASRRAPAAALPPRPESNAFVAQIQESGLVVDPAFFTRAAKALHETIAPQLVEETCWDDVGLTLVGGILTAATCSTVWASPLNAIFCGASLVVTVAAVTTTVACFARPPGGPPEDDEEDDEEDCPCSDTPCDWGTHPCCPGVPPPPCL